MPRKVNAPEKPAKNKGGRPSLYKPEYDKQAYKLSLLGATHAEIADFFAVSIDTIAEWRNVHNGFSESLKAGKDDADANVANKLYRRALGYSHKEDKIFLHEGQPVIVPTRKHYPPDPTSMIFWLKNRQPAKWRDKLPDTDPGKTGLGELLRALADRLPD